MKFIKYLIVFQGFFYGITGVWALVNLSSFLFVTQNFESPFKTEANGALFFVLGLTFILLALQGEHIKRTAALVVLITICIAFIDLYYLNNGGTTWPFWFDFAEELLVAVTLSSFMIFTTIF